MSFNWIDYFYINTESHTGEAILALIKNVTQKDFFLADRLDAVTTDNGTNFVRAVDLMLSHVVRCKLYELTACTTSKKIQ